MSKTLAICLPWYKSVQPQTAFCVTALVKLDRMRMFLNYGDAFIAHSRNTLARRFLDSECEWSLWIDDDIIPPIGHAEWFNRATGFGFVDKFAGLNTVDRLLSHSKTLVGGTYFGRSRDGKPMYAEACANAAEAAACRRGPQDVLKPTKWVATGCLLIHRRVFEDITKRWLHLDGQWFSSSEHDLVESVEKAVQLLREDPSKNGEAAIQLFERGQALSERYSRVGLGEDIQFCFRATEVGHQPHVDLGLMCGHVGTSCYGPFNTYMA